MTREEPTTNVTGRLLDGPVLHRWLVRAVDGLTQAGPRIDAVNVFPVADQDTGTNCLLTLRGALDELDALPTDADAETVLGAIARGTLLAARGNSGMILSHWFAGLARGAGRGMAAALDAAAQSARSAVLDPEDGTVLTLAAEVARAARAARDVGHADDGAALAAGLAAGRESLAEISRRHPVLRDARVLDAGACALLVVLTAWQQTGPLDLSWLPQSAPTALPKHGLSGFEVMAVLPAGDDDALRSGLAAVGDAVAVVTEPGDDPGRLRQSHVHTTEPAAAVAVIRAAAGSQPVIATVQALGGDRVRAVAVTGTAQAADELARGGAVVLVASSAASPGVWSTALGRAVRDARAGGAHRVGAVATAEPVPVLPGAWATECTAALPAEAMLIVEADDDARVLTVLCALAGETPA